MTSHISLALSQALTLFYSLGVKELVMIFLTLFVELDPSPFFFGEIFWYSFSVFSVFSFKSVDDIFSNIDYTKKPIFFSIQVNSHPLLQNPKFNLSNREILEEAVAF
ncbi:hypothetical protein LIER_43734 [Lithospermum erythrorhizon]|uniref:Uncharacterized protein n=1 Tax=Lithospermum erythrorhizon TaxID=34254 RepID=A0AAV3QQ61_LITER